MTTFAAKRSPPTCEHCQVWSGSSAVSATATGQPRPAQHGSRRPCVQTRKVGASVGSPLWRARVEVAELVVGLEGPPPRRLRAGTRVGDRPPPRLGRPVRPPDEKKPCIRGVAPREKAREHGRVEPRLAQGVPAPGTRLLDENEAVGRCRRGEQLVAAAFSGGCAALGYGGHAAMLRPRRQWRPPQKADGTTTPRTRRRRTRSATDSG